MSDREKKIIGILGGIGSGKSSVAKILAKNGYEVLNADNIAHEMLGKDDIKEQIVGHFGQKILLDTGEIDREELAELVFESREQTEKLNNIIHPGVMREIESEICRLKKEDSVVGIVLDVPLLMEVGWENRCDVLIFVSSELKKRLERAAKKGDFFKNQLEKRENLQISLDKKTKISHYVVENNSDLIFLKKQVEDILPALL